MGNKEQPATSTPPTPASSPAQNAPAGGQVGGDSAYLATIVQCSQDAIISASTDGLFESWNPAAERLLGYTAGEIIGKPVTSIMPEDRKAEWQEEIALLTTTGRVPAFETIRRRKDGSLVEVEVAISQVEMEGRPIGIMAVLKDISDRKRTERALRASEERHALVEKATNDGVWDWNVVTNEHYVSPRWKAMMGFDPGELAGNEDVFFPRLHPEDAGPVREAVRLHLEENWPFDVELRLRCKDGSYRWFNSRGGAIRDHTGRAIRMVGSIADITQRKGTEERLRHQARLLDEVSDAIISTDLDFRITTWNKAAERTFGWSAGQVLGREADEMLGTEYLATTKEDAARELRDTGASSMEVIMRDQCRNRLTFLRDSIVVTDDAGEPTGTVLILRDLTERRLAEQELLENEARLRAIFEQAAAGIAQTDLSGRIIFANPRFCENLGCDLGDLLHRTLHDITHPDDKATSIGQFREVVEDRRCIDVEKRYVHKDGSPVWVSRSLSPIVDASGTPQSVIVVSVDITERKKAEATARESEERFRRMADNAPVLIWVSGPDKRCTWFNQQWLNFVGRTLEQELGGGWAENVHPDDAKKCNDTYSAAFDARRDFEMTYRLRRRDGQWRWMLDKAVPRYTPDGEFAGYIGSCVDITERKDAEDALHLAYARLRTLFDQKIGGIGIVMATVDGVILDANDHYLEIIGRTREELLAGKLHWRELTAPESLPAFEDAMRQLRERGVCEPYEKEYVRPDGTRVSVLLADTVLPGASSEILAFVMDTTARKRAEAALRESEERFRRSFELGLVGMAITSPTKGWMEVNDKLCEMLGYNRSELANLTWAQLTHPDDLPADVANFDRAMAGEIDGYVIDKRFTRKNGEVIYTIIAARCMRHADGSCDYFVVLVQDITARKHAEDALRKSEERFRVALLNQPLTVFSQDRELRFTWIHNPHPQFRPETIVGKTDAEIMPAKYAARLTKLKRGVLESGKPARGEVTTPTDGADCWWDLSLEPTRNAAGEIIGVAGAAMNITERKQMTIALQESYDLLAKVSRQIPGVIYQFQIFPDGHSCFPYASEGIREIYEVTPEQVREDASAVFAILHPDDYHGIVASIQESVRTLEPWHYEYRVVLPKQGVRWRQGDALPERLADGSTLWHGFITDITERKRVQDALQSSEQQLSAIYANVSGIIFCLAVEPRKNFRFVTVNQAFSLATGLAEDQVVGKLTQEVIPKNSHPVALRGFRKALQTRKAVRWEEVSVYPSGEKHGVVSVTPTFDSAGKVTQLVGIVHDITERRKAEVALQQANAELENRVEERTASLLNTVEILQKTTADRQRLEKEIIEVSESERGRIGRDLHDDLGQQLAGIGWLSSVLEKNLRARSAPETASAARITELLTAALALTRSLARGLHPVPGEPGGLASALNELAVRSSELFKIRCRFACRRPVRVGQPVIATHLYRIAQEAVTNAVKHGKAKQIQIALSSSRGKILLTVTDNGEGLKKQDRGRTGLGMRIMHYRAETLGGSLDLQNKPGGGTRLVCALPVTPQSSEKRTRRA